MNDFSERAPLICEAITEAFGERCEDFEPDCWACKAWAELNGLTAALEEARWKALEEAANVADKYHWKRFDDPELIAAAIRALVKP